MSLAAVLGLVSEGSSLITEHSLRQWTETPRGKWWECSASGYGDFLVTDLMPRERGEAEGEMDRSVVGSTMVSLRPSQAGELGRKIFNSATYAGQKLYFLLF